MTTKSKAAPKRLKHNWEYSRDWFTPEDSCWFCSRCGELKNSASNPKYCRKTDITEKIAGEKLAAELKAKEPKPEPVPVEQLIQVQKRLNGHYGADENLLVRLCEEVQALRIELIEVKAQRDSMVKMERERWENAAKTFGLPCRSCKGSGKVAEDNKDLRRISCPVCRGTGKGFGQE